MLLHLRKDGKVNAFQVVRRICFDFFSATHGHPLVARLRRGQLKFLRELPQVETHDSILPSMAFPPHSLNFQSLPLISNVGTSAIVFTKC